VRFSNQSMFALQHNSENMTVGVYAMADLLRSLLRPKRHSISEKEINAALLITGLETREEQEERVKIVRARYDADQQKKGKSPSDTAQKSKGKKKSKSAA